MVRQNDAEAVLGRAAHDENLTDAEVQQVRDFLTTVKALGRIGKFLLWTVITAGALAAAISQVRTEWGG